MSKLPELVVAAKRVIENVDIDSLLSYFGLKTDLRQGAPAIKVSVLSLFCPGFLLGCVARWCSG